MRAPHPAPILLPLLLAATAPTQIFIVDATNGAGAHFTDLPAAVTATPDGATLRVKPGSYSPFTVTSKGLKIIGEGRVTIDRSPGNVEVRATSPSQQTLFRNLVFGPSGLVHLKDAAGPVTLDTCSHYAQLFVFPELHLERCRAVQLHACSSDGSATVFSVVCADSNLLVSRSRLEPLHAFVPWGQSGATLTLLRSRGLLFGSRVLGREGARGSCFHGIPNPGGPGSPCVDATASTFVSLANQIIGGAGGAQANCSVVGCGGDGAVGVRALDSAIFFLGPGPVGGPNGGFGSPGFGPPCVVRPRNGPPTHFSGQTTYAHDPSTHTPQAFVTGTQARGQTIQLTLEAQPATLAALLLSYSGLRVPFEPFGVGDILAQPALVLSPFSVPASGTYQFPWQLPASLPLGEIYTGQFVNLIGGGVLFASNPFPILATQ